MHELLNYLNQQGITTLLVLGQHGLWTWQVLNAETAVQPWTSGLGMGLKLIAACTED